MVDKPESVFEKLDDQGEKIDDISEKLEGVSVNDLYALAKRMWDYEDYQTAQKYYNHISLLRPLDWEAPLYASLCNFKGYHDMFFWTKVPEQAEPIIVGTIKYINNLELNVENKESEMSRCLVIIEEFIGTTNRHYFKYSKRYDDVNGNYVFELQEWFVNILEQVKEIELSAIKSFCSFLADCCLDNIKNTQLIASSISREKYNYLESIASKDWEIDIEQIIMKQEELNIQSAKSGNKLTPKEKNDIMLHGEIYYEYNDKVIAKRVSRAYFILGLLIILFSILGTVFSFLITLSTPFVFVFVMSILAGIILIVKAIKEKDRICCSSIFAYNKIKCRLTSNNSVVRESSVSIYKIYLIVTLILSYVLGVYMSIVVFVSLKDIGLAYKIVYCVCGVTNAIAQYISLSFLSRSHGYFDRDYKYLYNGQFYHFE